MSLEQWLQRKHLLPHEPTIAEMQQLFGVIDRDLSDAQAQPLSADSKFTFAYNAALQLCTIALYVRGYEVGTATKNYLSKCSTLRGQSMYDRAGVVEQKDADELFKTAQRLRTDVVNWLKTQHAELVPHGL